MDLPEGASSPSVVLTGHSPAVGKLSAAILVSEVILFGCGKAVV